MTEHKLKYTKEKKRKISELPLVDRRNSRNPRNLSAMFELTKADTHFNREDNSFSRFNSAENESSVLISS